MGAFSGYGRVVSHFLVFFRRRRRALRRPRPSLTSHSPRIPFPVFHCPSFPLSPAFSTPLLLLSFLPCVALTLCAFPSVYLRLPPSFIACLSAPLRWLTPSFFLRFSRPLRVDMRPRPVCLPSPVFSPADLLSHRPCPLSSFFASANSCPCFYLCQLTSPLTLSVPLSSLAPLPCVAPL